MPYSLSATYLRNRIIGALRSSRNTSAQAAANHIPQEFVFSHPTLQKLAIAVVRLIDPKNTVAEPVSPSQEIEEMIAKYSANLPTFRQGEKFSGEYAVLLTGSTGSLGSHILTNLLQNPKVGRVFTLDRASNPRERLAESFNLRGLPVDELKSDKLTCLVRDLSKPGLGLDAPTLQNVSYYIVPLLCPGFHLALSSFPTTSHTLYTTPGNSTSICPWAHLRTTFLECAHYSTSLHPAQIQRSSSSLPRLLRHRAGPWRWALYQKRCCKILK